MSRVRFMSPYLKGGRDTAKLTNRARYIATRPGVEVLRGEHSGQPATKKQQAYILSLIHISAPAPRFWKPSYFWPRECRTGQRQGQHPRKR